MLSLGGLLVMRACARTRDIPALDDADLRVQRLELTDDQNAYHYLDAAAEQLYYPEEERRAEAAGALARGEDRDQKLADEIVRRNRKTLELVERALACSHCQVPQMEDFADLCPYLMHWRRIGYVKATEARVLAGNGKYATARTCAMDVVRLGHMIEDCKGGLLHYSVGTSVKRMGLDLLASLTHGPGKPGALTRHAAELRTYAANEEGFRDMVRTEYQMTAKLVGDLATGWQSWEALGGGALPRGYTGRMFQPNRTSRLFARAARACLSNVGRFYSELDFSGIPPQAEPSNAAERMAFVMSPNAYGQILYAMLLPALPRQLMGMCEENTRVGATRVLLALRAYQLREGKLSDSLRQLVPDYLDAVPLDHFDGQPLRYSREKRSVYSVGEDLIDSDGVEGSEPRKRLDYVWPIEF